MNYQTKQVCECDSEELLFELIRRHGYDDAPKKVERKVPFVSTLVSIDGDHTAGVTMPEEDLERLNDLIHNPNRQEVEQKLNTFLQRE